MPHTPINAITAPCRGRLRSRSAYTLIELMIVLAILATIAGVSWPALMRPWSRSLSQQAAQQLTGRVLETRIRAIEDSRVYRLRFRPGSGQFRIDTPHVDSIGTGSAQLNPYGHSDSPADLIQPAAGDSAAGERSRLSSPTIGARATTAEAISAGRQDPAQLRRRDPLAVAEVLDHDVRFRGDADPDDRSRPTDALATENTPPDDLSRLPGDRTPVPMPSLDPTDAEFDDAVEWSDPVWFFPDGRTSNGKWTLVSEDGYQVDVLLRGLTGTVRVGPVRGIPKDDDT